MKRLLLLLACVMLLSQPVQAAVSCTSTNFAFNVAGASTTIAVTFPTANSAGDFKFLAVFDRTDETTTISSVVGSVDATGWTVAEGPVDFTNGTARGWTIYRANATAGTEVVTVTFSAAINSQAVGGWCSGVATTTPLDASAAVMHTGGTNTTTWNSNNASATMAGGIIGATFTNNAVTYTINGAGETQLSCGAAGQRLCVFFEPYASSGSYGFQLTASGTGAIGMFFVDAFKEPGGGGGPTPRSPLLLQGIGR